MMNLIQKFFRRDRSDKINLRKNFSKYFFSLPEHNWLRHSQTQNHFEELFSRVPVGLLDALMTDYPLIFVKNEDLRQYGPGLNLSNIVVVFPEFQKLIQSSNRAAVAYLAHELAFVIYELAASHKDPLMAEVEADKFVCDVGLEHELETLLLMLDETIEKRLRLTYLTLNHFNANNS